MNYVYYMTSFPGLPPILWGLCAKFCRAFCERPPTFWNISYVLKISRKKCTFLANKLLNSLMKSGKLSHFLKYFWRSGHYKTQTKRTDPILHFISEGLSSRVVIFLEKRKTNKKNYTLYTHLLTSHIFVMFSLCFYSCVKPRKG